VKEFPPDELLAQGAAARGPHRQSAYHNNEMAKVVTFAAARRGTSEEWRGLPAGTILEVKGATVEANDTWVRGFVRGPGPRAPLLVHSSFLEHYLPVVRGTSVELSDLRFTLARDEPRSASGWLYNFTSRTVSQTVVTCVFHDRADREITVTRDGPLVLPPWQLVRFRADTPRVNFGSVSIQISHATPDGLREYLPTVIVPRN